jgi:hypothetical protein
MRLVAPPAVFRGNIRGAIAICGIQLRRGLGMLSTSCVEVGSCFGKRICN